MSKLSIYLSGAVSQSRRNGLVMPASVPVRRHGLAAPIGLRCRKLLDVKHGFIFKHIVDCHGELVRQQRVRFPHPEFLNQSLRILLC